MSTTHSLKQTQVSGTIYHTDIVQVDGLSVALVTDVSKSGLAIIDLSNNMSERNIKNGIILFDRALAPQVLGNVPERVLGQGITYQLSEADDLRQGASKVVADYTAMRLHTRRALRAPAL